MSRLAIKGQTIKAPVERDGMFWSFPDVHVQRMTTAQWKYILLNNLDTFIANGRLRRLKAKSLGAGVYEVHAELENKPKGPVSAA